MRVAERSTLQTDESFIMSSKILDLTGRPQAARTFLNAALNISGQRRTLILLPGAIVVAALAFNWHWVVAAGLLPILFLAPCMIMMFMCMRHAAGSASDSNGAAAPAKLLSHHGERESAAH
jgi:hypothetical protein